MARVQRRPQTSQDNPPRRQLDQDVNELAFLESLRPVDRISRDELIERQRWLQVSVGELALAITLEHTTANRSMDTYRATRAVAGRLSVGNIPLFTRGHLRASFEPGAGLLRAVGDEASGFKFDEQLVEASLEITFDGDQQRTEDSAVVLVNDTQRQIFVAGDEGVINWLYRANWPEQYGMSTIPGPGSAHQLTNWLSNEVSFLESIGS